jgi:hypothetical protein
MKQRVLAGAVVLFGTVLAGCAGSYGYSSAYVGYGPPAPRYAVVGVAPGPGYVWINGYWGWRGGRYEWNEGRWERPPRGRHQWVEGQWHREGRGWRYHEGRWR